MRLNIPTEHPYLPREHSGYNFRVQRIPRASDFAALAIVVAAMVYAELYPFAFRVPVNDIGAFQAMMNAWHGSWELGDVLANAIFFLPFGFFCIRILHPMIGGFPRFLLTVIGGGLLSMGCELTQYFDADRFTSIGDVLANTVGVAIGATAGLYFSRDRELPWSWRYQINSKPFPTLLLASWLCCRLYPYLPSFDIEKYRASLTPLLHPEFSLYDVFHYSVM